MGISIRTGVHPHKGLFSPTQEAKVFHSDPCRQSVAINADKQGGSPCSWMSVNNFNRISVQTVCMKTALHTGVRTDMPV